MKEEWVCVLSQSAQLLQQCREILKDICGFEEWNAKEVNITTLK